MSRIKLNSDQRTALVALERGDNVFITGCGGTGKSVVIREFVQKTEKNVIVCAPTGKAAINVGGITVHKLILPPARLVAPYMTPSDDNELMDVADVIVVDEVSMLRIDMFEYLVTKAREYREKYNSEKIKYLGLKQYVDGTILGYTGELLEPYEDKPETRNEMPFDFDEITRNALAADREGFRVRLHTIGDGAVRIALDAFQRCREENGIRDSRHSIAHIEVVNDADIPRLNELGVIYDAHPAHVNLPCEKAEDNPYPVHLGKRADNCFMYKTILDTGAHLAVGSDFPVVEPDPMLGIYRGVTRKFNDGLPEEGWIPSERLSMAEILKAYTIGTAYHDFKDDITGTLEAGKCADIVILDRNLFDLETPEEILETKPVMTIFDGRIVYEA